MDCCLKKRILTIGNSFPNFNLSCVDENNKIISIDNNFFTGKKIVFFFYPLDFTFVCPTELNYLSSIKNHLDSLNTILITISTDSVYSHLEWKKSLNNINFLMASDLNRHLSQKLGILNDNGICSRTTYLIDENGIIQWLEVTPDNIGRNPNEIIRIIEALNTGQKCPANWQKGNDFIMVK
jgi:alkyl hydroperoxide reductase subunit AhpC